MTARERAQVIVEKIADYLPSEGVELVTNDFAAALATHRKGRI